MQSLILLHRHWLRMEIVFHNRRLGKYVKIITSCVSQGERRVASVAKTANVERPVGESEFIDFMWARKILSIILTTVSLITIILIVNIFRMNIWASSYAFSASLTLSIATCCRALWPFCPITKYSFWIHKIKNKTLFV